MRSLLLIMRCVSVFVIAYGDYGEETRFRCPRAYELDVNCIYKGHFVNGAECSQLCQNFFHGIESEFRTEAICENNKECRCTRPPLSAYEAVRPAVNSLTDLEEDYARGNDPIDYDESDYYPSGIQCGYYDGFVTMNECHTLCGHIQRSRGIHQNPWAICETHGRCKCEDFHEAGFPILVNLDTLEVQHRREMEQEEAANVRVWLEMHNAVGGSWGGYNNH